MDPVGREEQRLADANGEFEQTDRAGSGETAEDTFESRNTETEDATPGELGDRRSSKNDEDDREMNVAAVRRARTHAKTAFTKTRRALLSVIANNYTLAEIDGCSAELDQEVTAALEVMESLAALLELQDSNRAAEKVSEEMEKLEEEYSSAQNRAAEYVERICQREHRHMNYRRGLQHRQRDMSEERASSEDEAREQPHSDERDAERRARQEVSAGERETVSGHGHEQHEDRSRSPTEPAYHDWSRERERARTVEVASAGHPSGRAAAASNIDHRPPQPQPRDSNPFDVGQDLWQQLKCVTIPIFTGDGRAYSTWRAAFMACIDKAPATAEYKLLQLRQY